MQHFNFFFLLLDVTEEKLDMSLFSCSESSKFDLNGKGCYLSLDAENTDWRSLGETVGSWVELVTPGQDPVLISKVQVLNTFEANGDGEFIIFP